VWVVVNGEVLDVTKFKASVPWINTWHIRARD
jgi:hypothetical protein